MCSWLAQGCPLPLALALALLGSLPAGTTTHAQASQPRPTQKHVQTHFPQKKLAKKHCQKEGISQPEAGRLQCWPPLKMGGRTSPKTRSTQPLSTSCYLSRFDAESSFVREGGLDRCGIYACEQVIKPQAAVVWAHGCVTSGTWLATMQKMHQKGGQGRRLGSVIHALALPGRRAAVAAGLMWASSFSHLNP